MGRVNEVFPFISPQNFKWNSPNVNCCPKCDLLVLATYGAKVNEKQTPLHISLGNSVTRSYIKNLSLYGCIIFTFLYTFDILGHLIKKFSLRFLKDGLVTKFIEGNVQRGSNFC